MGMGARGRASEIFRATPLDYKKAPILNINIRPIYCMISYTSKNLVDCNPLLLGSGVLTCWRLPVDEGRNYCLFLRSKDDIIF